MAESLMVGGGRFGDARDGFLGDDQDVRGGLRCDVLEREHEVVFIYDLGWDFARDDFFKKGFAHGEVLFCETLAPSPSLSPEETEGNCFRVWMNCQRSDLTHNCSMNQ